MSLPDIALRVSAVLVVALGATALMRRQSAAARHWVLAAALACAAALPLLAIVAPAWQWPAAVSARDQAAPAAPARVAPPLDTRTHAVYPSSTHPPVSRDYLWEGQRLLGVIWAVGAVMSLAILLVGTARLANLRARALTLEGEWRHQAEAVARAYQLHRPVEWLESHHPALLVTWGALRPKVILPVAAADWPPERIRVVVSHELAHVRRGDWLVQMLAESLRAVFWFNPILWIACRRLREESECACDDMVLSLGVDRTDYATELLHLARSLPARDRRWLPAPAVARPSTLQKRIRAMLNTNVNRRPLARSVRVAAVAAVLTLTLSIAGFASQTFGSITGSILDAQGGVIPNATVKIANADTQEKHEVRTDGAGRFELVGLRAGTYQLEAAVMGFSRLRESVTLAPGQSVERNLTLAVGTLQETITVTYGGEPANARRPGVRSAMPPKSEPCTPAAVGGRIVPPTKVRDVRPRVSDVVIEGQMQGQVVLEAVIGTDGLVREVRTVGAAQPELEAAAHAAVKEWQFTPTTLNCVAVDVNMTVTVNFAARQ